MPGPVVDFGKELHGLRMGPICQRRRALGTASNFVHENKRRFPGDGAGNDDECGRGCADAHAGGIVAIVAGLAMVAAQGASFEFPDCLLAVGYLSVLLFVVLTAVGAVWNWLVGLFT